MKIELIRLLTKSLSGLSVLILQDQNVMFFNAFAFEEQDFLQGQLIEYQLLFLMWDSF